MIRRWLRYRLTVLVDWQLLAALFLVGCSSMNNTKPIAIEHPQRCEMCGAEWLVIDRSGAPVPPTVEWCFHDGQLCEEGFAMIQESLKRGDGETAEAERRWMLHCTDCQGCRCASFTPDKWRESIDQKAEGR